MIGGLENEMFAGMLYDVLQATIALIKIIQIMICWMQCYYYIYETLCTRLVNKLTS